MEFRILDQLFGHPMPTYSCNGKGFILAAGGTTVLSTSREDFGIASYGGDDGKNPINVQPYSRDQRIDVEVPQGYTEINGLRSGFCANDLPIDAFEVLRNDQVAGFDALKEGQEFPDGFWDNEKRSTVLSVFDPTDGLNFLVPFNGNKINLSTGKSIERFFNSIYDASWICRGLMRLNAVADADTFVFAGKIRIDTMEDLEDDIDTIRFDEDLWGGDLPVREVIRNLWGGDGGWLPSDLRRGGQPTD